jgi:uncharacterized protein (TIGR00299 family) protein
MKVLRIEPFSGVSGDMFLGALLDLGAPAELLESLPAKLGLTTAVIGIGKVDKCGILCSQVMIRDETPQPHRHLSHILEMINAADIPDNVQDLAGRIFTLLGKAEASVHGVPVEKVHFHEVGAVDSILDIVGAALLLEELEFDQVVCDPVCTGAGFVDCAHGRFPVPAPATALLLKGIPTFPGEILQEMTTPTGAAILKALEPVFAVPTLTVTDSGYGAGTRDFEQPNCLRLSLAETVVGAADQIVLVQTNLDDASGELLGEYFQNLLLKAGALDVNLSPLLMKKGRPGQRLEVLCRDKDREPLTTIILNETTTIGVRWFPVQRRILPRTIQTVETKFGPVRVKCVELPDGSLRRRPEFEDCRERAQASGVSVQEVMQAAQSAGS